MTRAIRAAPLHFISAGLGIVLLSLTAHGAGGQIVRGKITDSVTKAPVTRVVVTLVDSTDTPVGRPTYSDSLGLYTLRAPHFGTYSIQIRRLGYLSRFGDSFEVASDTTIQNLNTRPVVQQLAAVETRSKSIQEAEHLAFVGRQRAGFGKIYDRDKIVAENWYSLKDGLIQGAPGSRLIPCGSSLETRKVGTDPAAHCQNGRFSEMEWRGCRSFAFFRNGVQTVQYSHPDEPRQHAAVAGQDSPHATMYYPTDTTELNEILTLPADFLYALEFYVGTTEIPSAYLGGSRGYCGVIAYWTRPPSP